jgi:hypothetical protein
MNRGTLGFGVFSGLTLAVALGCSARSIVIGGDPLGDAGEGASTPAMGGISAGGTFAGGSGGSSATGGTLIPIGGTSSSTGGSATQGGIGAEGGGDALDPYPRVSWEDGQGYRRSCPPYEDAWGFTCWNFQDETRGCRPNGDPYCNACMCAVPCDGGRDCPLGITGHEADCISSATTTPSCFLVCDDGLCPYGMTCTKYPAADRFVCMWLSEQPIVEPPV